MKLDDYHYSIGVQFFYKYFDENYREIKVPFDIPENIGRFGVSIETEEGENIFTPFINCTGVFKDKKEEFDERERLALKNGHCMDTKVSTAMIKGTDVF